MTRQADVRSAVGTFGPWLTAIGATVVVSFDHGPLLDAIAYRRTRFIRDVLADFARVAAAVLRR